MSDDELAQEALSRRNIEVHTVSWRRHLDWASYELVIIRTTWDYQQSPEAFISALEKINAATRLENPLGIVKWNLEKSYLKDLELRGIPTVKTWFLDTMPSEALLEDACRKFGSEELIIKPLVSANADFTYRLRSGCFSKVIGLLQTTFSGKKYLLQPFLESVVEEGEYSVFYFGGHFSHAIVKLPKAEDFRVQEEHGGQILPILPTAELIAAADRVIRSIGRSLLYARVDLVRQNGELALMELELIEPSLYFRTSPTAASNFADAVEKCLNDFFF
ncbi:MAG: hypothetical protein RMM17_06135 [Acidobacteriota bacterium]|nr:hypothetical protein [Blastocatellia bacterium]MDW8412247.1 hypothetical protein [Acidobacteriota bacterium]